MILLSKASKKPLRNPDVARTLMSVALEVGFDLGLPHPCRVVCDRVETLTSTNLNLSNLLIGS